ncbi:MAG: beta-lactamase family protein [Kiritimatiellae bacterium]|nr:beta-lactamase family protein [Kiritimatiellia bacterium]
MEITHMALHLRHTAALALALACTSASYADKLGVNSISEAAQAAIDKMVHAYSNGYDRLGIGLAVDGEVVFAKIYGSDDLDHPFKWQSVGKTVVAMTVLQLYEQGRIRSLDDPVSKYAPQYADKMPAAYQDTPITIRHVLTHTSGLPHVWRVKGEPVPTFKKEDGRQVFNLKFRPGTDWSYSTRAMLLLRHVIEGVTGNAFPDAVDQLINKKVGGTKIECYGRQSAGSTIQSPILDMTRFAAGVMNHAFVSEKLLKEELAKNHWDNLRGGEAWQGLIWWVLREGDHLVFQHNGHDNTGRSFLYVNPGKRRSAAISLTLKRGGIGKREYRRLLTDALALVQ